MITGLVNANLLQRHSVFLEVLDGGRSQISPLP